MAVKRVRKIDGKVRLILVCGKKNATEVSTLIVGGEKVVYGDAPWHVAIYEKSNYILICGGTIITPYLVVSAAHCFYDRIKDEGANASNFQIVVSKITRKHSQVDNGYQQSYELKTIHYPERGYHGLSTYHTSDVALLEVEGRIQLGATVLPACVEWNRVGEFNPVDNTPGEVVGWGIDDSGSLSGSETLKIAILPFIRYSTCIKIVPPSFKPFITYDKFCAGNPSDSDPGVRQGDSGGGLLFKNTISGLYYLYGVVSIKDNSNTSIAAFTDVTIYLEWINKVRTSIEKVRQAEDIKLPLKTG